MAWTFTTSALCIKKAGANVNATIVADTTTQEAWNDEIEGVICNTSRYDCITNWATLTASGRALLGLISSSFVAKHMLSYEPEAIGVQGATLRINVLENNIKQGLKDLADDNKKAYLGISS